MVMDVIYTPAAHRGLKELPKADRARVLEAFDLVGAEHPRRLSFVTELRGKDNAGVWRLRKGDYRAIFRITDTAIEVITVGHRRDIYE